MPGTPYNGKNRHDNPRYRNGSEYAASMKVYMDQLSEMNTNKEELSRVKQNLLTALKEDVTPRQREMLTLYYGQQMNMREIAALLGVHKSTVSRTIKRGARRLQRCLRYGAAAFLSAGKEDGAS